MRIMILSGCVAAACVLAMPAMAQDNVSQGADTTCTVFMAMDESAQTTLMEQLGATPDTGADAAGGMSENSKATAPEGGNAAAPVPEGAPNSDNPAADQIQSVLAACQDDGKLTVGQALEVAQPAP